MASILVVRSILQTEYVKSHGLVPWIFRLAATGAAASLPRLLQDYRYLRRGKPVAKICLARTLPSCHRETPRHKAVASILVVRSILQTEYVKSHGLVPWIFRLAATGAAASLPRLLQDYRYLRRGKPVAKICLARTLPSCHREAPRHKAVASILVVRSILQTEYVKSHGLVPWIFRLAATGAAASLPRLLQDYRYLRRGKPVAKICLARTLPSCHREAPRHKAVASTFPFVWSAAQTKSSVVASPDGGSLCDSLAAAAFCFVARLALRFFHFAGCPLFDRANVCRQLVAESFGVARFDELRQRELPRLLVRIG